MNHNQNHQEDSQMTSPFNTFINEVALMRTLQKQYFEARKKSMYLSANELLKTAKASEYRVDTMLKHLTAPPDTQQKLFDE